MNTQDFFRRILPDTGLYCLTKLPQGDHIWFSDIADMAEYSDDHATVQTGWYFALAGFDAESRKIEHVSNLRSFWLDIDAGAEKYAKHQDKVYPTQRDALIHLSEFTDWLGIKPSLIVSSGAGLHVYYTFDQEIPTLNYWQSGAKALRKAAEQFGLRIDAGITIDRARILRPLGALHQNGKHVKVIFDNGGHNDLLKMFKALMAKVTIEREQPAKKPSINDDLYVAPPPSSIIKIATKCGWVADALESKGRVPEPEWRAMLGLIKLTVEGESFAHSWSSGADSYSYDETQRKMDKWVVGAPSCASSGSPRCKTCEHNGKIKGPFSLGYIAVGESVKVAKPSAPAATAGGFDAFGDDEPTTPKKEKVVTDTTEDDAASSVSKDGVLEIVGGRRTKEQMIEDLSRLCQRKKLIKAGLLPTSFPSMANLAALNSQMFFFVRGSSNGVALYAGYQKEVNIAGEKVIRTITQILTEQPFHISAHAQSELSGSEVSVQYMHQYQQVDDVTRTPVWKYRNVQVTDFSENSTFKKQMSEMGISYADTSKIGAITDMLQQFVQANLGLLRRSDTAVQISNHMGFQFSTSTKEPLYVQGYYSVGADGAIKPCSLGSDLRNIAKRFEMNCISSDDLRAYRGDAYQEIIKPAAQKYCEGVRRMYGSKEKSKFALAWLLGTASPYLTFVTDEEPSPNSSVMPGMGVALSLYSVASGLGKTSLQKVIVAAFAAPEENKAGGNKETGMSAIALGINLSQLGCVPFMLDEVTNNDAETASQLIHKISSGRDKSRGTSVGKAAPRTGTWASVTTMSTNVSQRSLISQHREASTAEQMRVIEICFDGVERGESTSWMEDYNSAILANQGALGLVLGRFGTKNWSAMRNLAMTLLKQVETKYNITSGERYFAKVFTAALLALSVMEKAGMQPVYMKNIVDEFENTLKEVRAYLRDSVMDDTGSIEDLIQKVAPRILMTASQNDRRSENSSKGNSGNIYDTVYNPEVVRQGISGRYIAADKRLLIITKQAKAWAMKGGHDLTTLLKNWEKAGILVTLQPGQHSRPRRLGTGIHESVMPPTSLRCIEINMAMLEDRVTLPDNIVPITVVESQTATPTNNEGVNYNESNK